MQRMTYTIVEAAQLLGVGKTTLYEAVRLGEIRAVKIRGRMVIARPVLTELLGCEPPSHPNEHDTTRVWRSTNASGGFDVHGGRDA